MTAAPIADERPWRIIPLSGNGFAVKHPTVEIAIWAATGAEADRIASNPPAYIDAALRSAL